MSDQEVLDTRDEAEEVVEKSMEDTIRETMAEIETRGDTSLSEEVKEEPEETEEQKADRVRDEQGRFAKAEEIAEPIEEPVAEVVAETTVPPELQRLGLRKEEADAIAKDPTVMQAFIRRSEEMHKGLEQYRAKAQFGDAMERVIAPHMQTMQAIGVTPDQAVGKLLAADNSLRYGTPQQKLSMITQIARDYGVDLGQATEFSASLPPVDPRVQALETQLQQTQSWIQQQQQAREWQERQSLNSTIDGFSKDPAHIHFEAVRNDMAGLLQAGLATDLKDAYEKAIYANPVVRGQVLAKQQEETEAKRKAEASQKAIAAKTAAAANIKPKGKLPAAKAIGSMEETIRETAERLGII